MESTTSTIEFRGETYKIVPELASLSCKGCSLYGKGPCTELEEYSGINCYDNCTIWIKQPTQQKETEMQPTKTADQPKYTVEEIVGYCLEYFGDDDDDNTKLAVLLYVNTKLAQKQDPDYQKYLELKAKYEPKN